MPTYQQNKEHIKRNHAQKDRLNVWIPKEGGLKQIIQAHAASNGEALQQFILRAIMETMERDKKNQENEWR